MSAGGKTIAIDASNNDDGRRDSDHVRICRFENVTLAKEYG